LLSVSGSAAPRLTLSPYPTLVRSRQPGQQRQRRRFLQRQQQCRQQQRQGQLAALTARIMQEKAASRLKGILAPLAIAAVVMGARSEEHTSELQSREKLVCRLLLEK